MKKTLITAGLIASLSLVAVACDNNDATPEPTTPAEAVESMVAEDVQAAEETMEAVESMVAEDAADVQDAVESMVAEESPAA